MSNDNSALENYHQGPIIGYHRAPLTQKFGAPRQPNLVALISVIEMVAAACYDQIIAALIYHFVSQ